MNKQVGGAVAISAAGQLKRAAWRATAIVACVIGALAGASPGVAQDATWLASPTVPGPTPGSFDFNANANWATAGGTTPTPAPGSATQTGTATFGSSTGTNISFSSFAAVSGWTFNAGASAYSFTNNNSLIFNSAGIVVNGGSATLTNNGFIEFQNASSAGSATFTNNHLLRFHDFSTAGDATITNNSGGDVFFLDRSTAGNARLINNSGGTFDFSSSTGPSGSGNGLSAGSIEGGGVFYLGGDQLTVGGNNLSTTVSGVISDCGTGGTACTQPGATGGSLVKTGTGTLTLSGANTYTGATVVNGGTLQAGAANVFSASSATTINTGGMLDLGGFAQTIDTVSLAGGTLQNGTLTGAVTSSGGTMVGIGGTTTLTTTAGTTTFTNANTYTGATVANGGTLQAGAANVFSASSATTINTGGTLDLGGLAQTINTVSLAGGTLQNGSLAGAVTSSGGTVNGINGTASLTTTGGTTIVTGTNTYNGVTTVNGGVLDVVGRITNSSAVNVNAGGTLTGIGSVDPIAGGPVSINNGSTLAPGNGTPGTSLTISSSLAFQSGALYVVQLNPATASFASVTRFATLGGATVNAVFANGSYVAKQYTILTATDGVSGTFGPLVNTNLSPNFKTALSYDANDVFLNLSLAFIPPPGSGLSGNQQAVSNAIINFFNTNGSIPLVFGSLTPAGLTQLSGETAVGSQQTTFNAMGQFMGLLTDPFMNRGGGFNVAPGASGFAEEDTPSAYAAKSNPTDALAFAKAPLAKTYDPRWSVWASAFGGSQSTSGNVTLGSNNTTSNIGGTAVGADYLFSPNTIAGFALAGGGTSFNVANGGTGRSDLFQAGAYLRHTQGPAYVSASLAYGWQDITTNRTVTVAGFDQLRAQFNANAWSGRLEGGYRFVSPWVGGIGITPYAAAQFVTFDLPGYTEQAVTGLNTFALGYGAHNATDARTELGIRTDKSWAQSDGILTLRGRFAWAHDFDPDRSIAATFQTLPGASFVVNGAAQAADSALTTASIEKKWKNGWSAATTFEGEFSSVTNSYAGKGVVRYAW
jgi:autotransporter-associated beta strand protein